MTSMDIEITITAIVCNQCGTPPLRVLTQYDLDKVVAPHRDHLKAVVFHGLVTAPLDARGLEANFSFNGKPVIDNNAKHQCQAGL